MTEKEKEILKDQDNSENSIPSGLSRRQFIGIGLGGAAVLLTQGCKLFYLSGLREIENPLAYYPSRGWEKVYRNQYKYDAAFTYVCSPNCTHECRMQAFVRNGVLVRTEQNYDCHKIKDLYGNQATYAWNPRGCSNGFTFHRRVYGSYRLKYPLVRKGWKRWADDGFPYLTPENKAKYKFAARGDDTLEKISWPQVEEYIAKAILQIAETYSGPEGEKRLLEQGYPKEMLMHWE